MSNFCLNSNLTFLKVFSHFFVLGVDRRKQFKHAAIPEILGQGRGRDESRYHRAFQSPSNPHDVHCQDGDELQFLTKKCQSFGLFLHENQHLTFFFLHQQSSISFRCVSNTRDPRKNRRFQRVMIETSWKTLKAQHQKVLLRLASL